MGSVHLQPRPLYGIGTVARLTGIKPDTLRIWERRYQLGASHKSASGRRQYTQADLEHLQLVAALVANGARIGEIAASQRRTLEMMLRARSGNQSEPLVPSKPRVAFIGDNLCAWLDEHQGCLMNVDAILAPCALSDLDARLIEGLGNVDSLVVESGSLNPSLLQSVEELAATLDTAKVLLLHIGEGERWSEEMQQHGFRAEQFPPDPARLAVYLRCAADAEATEAGAENLGDLVTGKPRLFSPQEVAQAGEVESLLGAECPRISDLVQDLAALEDSVANRNVSDWEDVSVQACVYAYVGQARWLMEKALGLVLDGKSPDNVS